MACSSIHSIVNMHLACRHGPVKAFWVVLIMLSVFTDRKHQVLCWEGEPKLSGCNNASNPDLQWMRVLPISLHIGILSFCSGKIIKHKDYLSIFQENKGKHSAKTMGKTSIYTFRIELVSCDPSNLTSSTSRPAVSLLSATWWESHSGASCTNHSELSAPPVRLSGRSIM